ncbi:MAG: ABC transporter ATP-binding protein [Ignavibacteria bacterium]|nr:ABC transporter ATP-binding protein [Ignavibacteria bacterium]
MTEIKLQLKNIKKTFGRRLVFDKLNVNVNSPNSLIITGKNGSGKSTLVKIISGLLTPNSGELLLHINEKKIDRENYYQFMGLVSPYLVLYDEFSAEENLILIQKIRGIKIDKSLINNLLKEIGLYDRKDDLLRTFSSGMKQRMKYASAILHNPKVLCLDEPTANLDSEGKEFVEKVISDYRKNGIVIIATNEKEDLKFGDLVINLDEFKSR